MKSTYTHPTYSLGERLRRGLWQLCYSVCFRFSPVFMHNYRCWLLRVWGGRIGSGCHIYPNAHIWAPWHLSCEDQACIGPGAILYNHAPIYLGYRSIVSQGAYLCTATHDYQDARFPLVAKPIHLGRYAWVAAQAFVHPGVILGDGTVVGARSVVKNSMPEWTVCEGFPCAPIKNRKRF